MSSIPEVPQNVLCLKCGRDAVILILFLCCTFVKENRHCNSIKVIRPRLLPEELWRNFNGLLLCTLFLPWTWYWRSDNRKSYIGGWIYPEFSMAGACEVFRFFSRVLFVFNVVWHETDWDIETMGRIGCIMQVALWSRWRSGTVAHRDKRAVAPVATSSLFLPLRRVDLSLFVRAFAFVVTGQFRIW